MWLLFVFGCSAPDTQTPIDSTMSGTVSDEPQVYESAKDGFSIQYPSTWSFQENIYNASVMFFAPLQEGDKLKENVSISKIALDKTYTLEQYYALTKPDLVALKPGFTEVSNDIVSINGLDAQQLIYTGSEGGIALQWAQICLIQDKTAYIITYTATQETFDEYIEAVHAMVATLEIGQ